MGLNPRLVEFQKLVDQSFPNRPVDWTWGDTSHKARKSDHNTGDAVDVRVDGAKADKVIDLALKDPNTKYIIHNRRIWTRTGGWKPFTGTYKDGRKKDPHLHHVHVSFYRKAAQGDPNKSAVPAPKKTKRAPAAKRKPATTRARATSKPAKKKGGKKIVQGEHSVVLGKSQLMAAHVETPHTGGGKIKKGSQTVFVGPKMLQFARIGDPTTDGYGVVSGNDTVEIG